MKNILLLATAFCLALSSCINDVDIDLPENPKLSVVSFISPEDTLIKVQVSKTYSPLASIPYSPEYISTATVVISHGSESLTLPYVDSLEAYVVRTADFPLIESEKYQLSVSANGLSCQAECQIPKLVDLDGYELKVDSVETFFEGISKLVEYEYKLKIQWTDNESGSYYKAAASLFTEFTHMSWDGPMTIITEWMYYDFYGQSYPEEVSDEDSPNGPMEVLVENRLSNYYDLMDPDNNSTNRPETLYINLANLDYSLYKYQITRAYAEMNNFNPFGEPVQTYSNMQGQGVGVFGAYRLSRLEVPM